MLIWTGGGRLNLCCGVWCEIDLVAESRLNKFNAGHDRARRRSTASGGSTQVLQIDHRWEKVLRFVMISDARGLNEALDLMNDRHWWLLGLRLWEKEVEVSGW